ALWHAAATPEPPVSQGTHAGAIATAMLTALITAVVAGVGWRASRQGRGATTGLTAVMVGWLLLLQGLSHIEVLRLANVLSNGP
ncbi:hypothetical protein, partial [Enterococcus faecalis]|uniref:hypothetical protein n=2 Tax=Bacillati TaxID=1783272 RepID=UPI003D6C5B7F